MTDALRLTLRQDRPKPVAHYRLVRFHCELKAEHRKVLDVD